MAGPPRPMPPAKPRAETIPSSPATVSQVSVCARTRGWMHDIVRLQLQPWMHTCARSRDDLLSFQELIHVNIAREDRTSCPWLQVLFIRTG